MPTALYETSLQIPSRLSKMLFDHKSERLMLCDVDHAISANAIGMQRPLFLGRNIQGLNIQGRSNERGGSFTTLCNRLDAVSSDNYDYGAG